MPSFLVQFAQFHEEFRLPELLALAKLENVDIKYEPDNYKLNLHAQVKKTSDRWNEYMTCSFKFVVSAFGSTINAKDQLKIINSFSYLGFEGPIDMKNPDVQFHVLADHGTENAYTNKPTQTEPHYIYMGKLVATGSRDLVNKYNLKKRKYLGTTSMDAELSLVMANQALAAPGKIVYDPFVGTGSFLFTCAHFGAYTLGSDIDGRQIRGKGEKGIRSNVEQYNLQGRVLDTLVFDICHNPWRTTEWIDAIVTDPPYGVRAGAKKLGRNDGKELAMRTYDGIPMHTRDDYYPPTKPYEMSEVLVDLLKFSARHLTVGGRLVYWLPTVVDEYSNTDVPQHPCMKLVANSEQNFGQWSRRLITMEKIKAWTKEDDLTETEKAEIIEKGQEDPKRPGHFLFREKYFNFGRT
ncbi:tRNA guanosine-2'-O-methyltransferase [Rhizopus microsporus]|uniref:tRNA (guanine(10)-N(2))-methyltransferase n=1 Tax=Rhizopus microsporus TaxID=58291 RepID=A0A1X0RY79_RHIZD|nr:tRNA guanosine-2'-O-methyltransferase [Rhizopus microsporus]